MLEIIYSDGFAAAIEEFINDRFRGIAHVSHGELSSLLVYSGQWVQSAKPLARKMFFTALVSSGSGGSTSASE